MYFWQWPSQVPEQRWLAYHYTELGRGNYFGQWTPHHPLGTREEKPWIPLHKTWQTNILWPMNPTVTRAEMTCITLHKSWQMTLLWPMAPLPSTRPDIPEYQYTKLGRQMYFWQWPSQVPEQRWLAYHYTQIWQMTLCWPMAHLPSPDQRCLEYYYTKLSGQTYFGQWIPQYQSRDELHTTTQRLTDDSTLAKGPLPIWEQRCLEYHYKNLADKLTLANGPPVPEQRSLEYHYTKLDRWTYFGQCLPGTWSEMTCIQIYKTWQMNLLWPMDPHPSWVPEKRCLEYHYTKLGRQTYFGWWTTQVPEQWWLAYHHTNLGT